MRKTASEDDGSPLTPAHLAMEESSRLVGVGWGTPTPGQPEQREQVESEMPTSSAVGRVAAILALAGAAIVVLLLLVGGGGRYTVTAKFENASQLVNGNTVNVAGVAAGSVEDISLADDGQALVELEVSDEYAPLPPGHPRHRPLAVALGDRQPLRRPRPAARPTTGDRDDRRSGGVIEQAEHHLRGRPRPALQRPRRARPSPRLKSVIKGFARSYDGVGAAGQPRLLLPQPLPLDLPPGVRRAQLRQGRRSSRCSSTRPR